MGSNYQRFVNLLTKWPLDKEKPAWDYGFFLRNYLKKRDINHNIFPGNTEENSKRLDALLRLINNTYDNKYPCAKTRGGSGLELKEVGKILISEVLGKSNK